MPAAIPLAAAAVVAGGSIIAGNAAADATESASRTSAEASDRALDFQKKQYEQGYKDAAPYRDITRNALYKYADDLGIGGERPAGWVKQPPKDVFNNYEDSDVYKNSVKVGEKAIGRISPVYASGSRLKALLDYNTNLASNFRQEAVNNQEMARNRLASLLGAGQTANINQQQLGSQFATNIGNQTIAAGNMAASGQLALGQVQANTANQVGSIAGRALNTYLTQPQTPEPTITTPAYQSADYGFSGARLPTISSGYSS